MNALQATLDFIPSSPTLQAIGSSAASSWQALASAFSLVVPLQQSQDGASSSDGHDRASADPHEDVTVLDTLITRMRAHSCSTVGGTPSQLPWPTSPVLQTQLPPQALPRSKSYTVSLCGSPASERDSSRRVSLTEAAMLTSRTSSPAKSMKDADVPGPAVLVDSNIDITERDENPQPFQRPASRTSILASAIRAMNGSPRLSRLAPVHENDDIDGNFMLPPPRTRTTTVQSHTSSSSTITARASNQGKHGRSQSSSSLLGPMGALGIIERKSTTFKALDSVTASPPKSKTTTALSTVLATCLDNIDLQQAEQRAVQFRNPFALSTMPSSPSGRSLADMSHVSMGGAISCSATLPDLASILAPSPLLALPRNRTVSSCSSKVQKQPRLQNNLDGGTPLPIAHSLPVSNSGIIELVPSAAFFPPRPQVTASVSGSRACLSPTSGQPMPIATGGRGGAVQATPQGGPRRANSLPRGYLPRYKEFREPVPVSALSSPRSPHKAYKSAGQYLPVGSMPESSSPRAGRRQWDSSAPIYKLSQASPVSQSVSRHRNDAGPSKRVERLLRPIDTGLANGHGKRGSSSSASSSGSGSGSAHHRRSPVAMYDSSSPASSFLQLPPLSAGGSSTRSSCSSASLEDRLLHPVSITTPKAAVFPLEGKLGRSPSAINKKGSERRGAGSSNGPLPIRSDRWDSLAYVYAREPFPLESVAAAAVNADPKFGSLDKGQHDGRTSSSSMSSSWHARPGTTKKATILRSTLRVGSGSSSSMPRASNTNKSHIIPSDDEKGSTGAPTGEPAPTPTRPSSISSSLSFLLCPSRPSSSSVATRPDTPAGSGSSSSSGFSFIGSFTASHHQGSRAAGLAGEGEGEGDATVVKHREERRLRHDDDDEEEEYGNFGDGEGEGDALGWNTYVSMHDVHSPVLERGAAVFPSSFRPAGGGAGAYRARGASTSTPVL